MKRNNRTAGNSYEREIAIELRELGYLGVITTRMGSKQMDDDGIDLYDKELYLPVFFQLKNYSSDINVVKLLTDFDLLDYTLPLIVLHKHTKKVNNRFYSIGEYFYMYESVYLDLISRKLNKQIDRDVFISTVVNGFHEYEDVNNYAAKGIALTKRYNKLTNDTIITGTKELLYKILKP